MTLDIMNNSRGIMERIIQFFSLPVVGAFLFTTALCFFIIWRITRKKNKKFNKINLPAEITKVSTFRKSKPLILKELSRTRRYQHPLSLLVLNLEKELPDDHKTVSLFSPQATNGDNHKSSISQQTLQLGFMLAGTILHDSLRESDIVTYDVSNNQFIVVLPETNKLQAQDAAKRLNRIFLKRSLFRLRIGLAEFPQDGWIIEDLVNIASNSTIPLEEPDLHFTKEKRKAQEQV